jgi:hypothetical protein
MGSDGVAWTVFWIAVAVSAALGIASNKVGGSWGLLFLPAEVCACALLILVPKALAAPETPSLQDWVNAFMWMLFPFIALAAPPFLVGRYVPQVAGALRQRRSNRRKQKHVA